MKKILALSLFPLAAWAQSPGEPMCEPGSDIAQVRAHLDFEPQYFFKPMPQQGPQDKREEVSIITRDGNVFYDMKTGKYRRVPGSIDGTATPDGQFMVTPINGLSFFDRDTISANSQPAFEDVHGDPRGNRDDYAKTLEGVYQSVGLLPGSAPNKVYRAITDTMTEGNTAAGTLMYKDFSTKPGPNGPVFDANDHLPKPLCPNLGASPLKLPMISKDGKMLAAFDVASGSTKIFNVKQVGGVSRCELKKDLGFATGKVEFSPDGKRITFAADSHSTNRENVHWYEQPRQNQNFNVYVVDMEEDSIQRVSKMREGSAYYPSFGPDNSVVYLEQVPGRNGANYSVVKTPLENTQKMKFTDFQSINSCSGVPAPFLSSMALGALWYNICGYLENNHVSTQGLAFMPLAMDPKKCQELVKRGWKDFQDQLKSGVTRNPLMRITGDTKNTSANLASYYQQFVGLSEASLLAACPKNNKVAPAAVEVNPEQEGENDIEGENKLLLCQQCHTSQHAYPIDFSDPKKLADRKQQIFGVVFTRHMPKGSTMSEDERAKLLDWIEENVPNAEK